MGNPKLKNEIETLKQDATKIVSDISSLSKTMSAAGQEKSQEFADDVSKRAEAELKAIKERMHELEARSKEFAAAVDTHVKRNPYLYILGFLGLGILLGKFMAPGSR